MKILCIFGFMFLSLMDKCFTSCASTAINATWEIGSNVVLATAWDEMMSHDGKAIIRTSSATTLVSPAGSIKIEKIPLTPDSVAWRIECINCDREDFEALIAQARLVTKTVYKDMPAGSAALTSPDAKTITIEQVPQDTAATTIKYRIECVQCDAETLDKLLK